MHIAYLNPAITADDPGRQQPRPKRCRLRRQAYASVCKKYAGEIRAIQQYQPGWMPRF